MEKIDKEVDTVVHGFRGVYLALYLVGAVLSGAGGNYLWMRSVAPSVVAPDRFTGSEAALLKSRISHIESTIDTHTQHHPDDVNQFDRRITTLEVQYAAIISNQGRIIAQLDKLNGR